MEEFLQHLYVGTLRAKMDLCRVIAATLMDSLHSPTLTVYERQAGFRRWEEVTQNGDTLEFMLELIRRREKEGRGFHA
jgi:hypothetical protein